MELFRRCKSCNREKPVFRSLGICIACYENKAYLARRVKALKCDPAKVHKTIGNILAGVRDLRDAGMLPPTDAVYLMTLFNRVTQQLSATISFDDEAVEMAEAAEEYARMQLRSGAVEAESLEQAKELLVEQEKPKLPAGEKPEDAGEQDEEKKTA